MKKIKTLLQKNLAEFPSKDIGNSVGILLFISGTLAATLGAFFLLTGNDERSELRLITKNLVIIDSCLALATMSVFVLIKELFLFDDFIAKNNIKEIGLAIYEFGKQNSKTKMAARIIAVTLLFFSIELGCGLGLIIANSIWGR